MAQINNSGSTAEGTETTASAETSNTVDNNVTDAKTGEDSFDEKVFENPKLWQHPRFKSLNERAKLADKLEADAKTAREAQLAEAKKFEELATIRAQERDEFKNKFLQSVQDNRIIAESAKVGVVDIEAVLKLVNRENIRVDDAGNVIGVTESIAQLVESKPYLKGRQSNITIGSATNPPADSDTTVRRFKLSQLNDIEFYRANEKDINKAFKLGFIEDDMTK